MTEPFLEGLKEARAAAKAMFALSKVAQNGGFPDLIIPQQYVDDIPETFRGWVTRPSGARRDEPAPHGGRLFVDFLDEFRCVVVEPAIERATIEVLEGPLDAGLRSLVDRSYIWHAPSSGRSRASDLTEEGKRVDELAQREVVDILVTQPRPDADEQRSPWLLGFDGIVSGLRDFIHRGRNVDWAQLVDLWDWDADDDSKLRAVVDLALSKAVDRFPDAAASPVAALHAKLAREHHLARNGLCPDANSCDQQSGGSRKPQGCACWWRFAETYGLPQSGHNSSRDARKGLVALQIAANQLVKAHVHDLEPVTAVRIAKHTPPEAAAADSGDNGLGVIGCLIHLQDSRLQYGRVEVGDAEVLTDAARALDKMDSREVLQVVAAIAASAVVAAGTSNAPGQQPLDHAIMHLARTVAGAFRELRRPAQVLNVLSPLQFYLPLDSPIELAHFTHLEAHQDLQLAFQRTQNWQLAAGTYHRAQATLDEYERSVLSEQGSNVRALSRKAVEVREQLVLGRVGGLVLQGEAAIRGGQLVEAAAALRAADGLSSQVEVELERLDRLDADERSSDLGTHLRYGARWQVMPALMRYRSAVARTLIETVRPDSTRHDRTMSRRAAREARQRVEYLRQSLDDLFTTRHEWELNRIDLVAALLDEDIDFSAVVRRVRDLGGDDGSVGDYVVPMLRWAVREQATAYRWSGGGELLGAIDLLLDRGKAQAPRLPDLDSLRASD